MKIVGFEGRDHLANAMQPNLSILSVRYPAANLAAFRSRLGEKVVPIAYYTARAKVGGLGPLEKFGSSQSGRRAHESLRAVQRLGLEVKTYLQP